VERIVIPNESEESHPCGVGEISPQDQILGRKDDMASEGNDVILMFRNPD
jgi:hypothetical protein